MQAVHESCMRELYYWKHQSILRRWARFYWQMLLAVCQRRWNYQYVNSREQSNFWSGFFAGRIMG